METTRITAIRHGETDWNVERRLQGHKDIALNARGQWQAQRVGAALAQETVDSIYSSDLQRAHATARAIQQARAGSAGVVPALHLDQGLRERAFGSFEGQTYEAIAAQWPEESRRWRQRDPDFAPPGGESPLQTQARVAQCVQAIAERHPGQSIVLVTHGGVLDMLYRLATGQSVNAARSWELGNAAINRLLWTGHSLSLIGWSDSRHLDEATLDETSV